MTVNSILQDIDNANSYHQCHAIATRNLDFIDYGSSRCVFAVDDQHVMKVAMNHSGVLQNGKESDISHICEGIPFLSHIVEYSNSRRAIITERVSYDNVDSVMRNQYKICPERFQESMLSLSNYIAFKRNLDDIEGGRQYLDGVVGRFPDIFSSLLGGFLLDLSLNENVILSDTGKKGGVGLVDMNLKVVDYGLTPRNFNTFHNPNNQLTEMESILQRLKFNESDKQMCMDYDRLKTLVG